MAIWKVTAVEQDPEVSLLDWRIFETDQGTRHFVGLNARCGTARASSRIVSFDAVRRTGVTQSGRAYRLVGGMGGHPDCDYVWGQWCRINNVISYTDVSATACALSIAR